MLNKKSNSLYERYALRRDELGFTDYKVAQIAGVDRKVIYAWRDGISKPNADNRMKIAKAIKKNITFLM